MKLSSLLMATVLMALSPHRGEAQQEITIQGTAAVGLVKPIPVSLAGFSGEAQKVLRFDLEVAGCEIVEGEAARYGITGQNNGQVQGELRDAVTKAVLLNQRYAGGSIRSQAHSLADDVIEKITGKPGISRFKIAFKGEGNGKSEIYISDFDGANITPVTPDGALVAAPAWVPGKRTLYYTSYKAGYPDIYSHDLGSGDRKAVARYPGLNTSAAISPDGKRLAMILSKSGSPDLYVGNADGTHLKQLTRTREDESSPCWSPDGRQICYVSAVSGPPGLYVIAAEGGAPRRLRTPGVGRVSEPDWSPDGKTIVFTSMSGEFTICTMPAQGGEVVKLTPGEDPSWAPNSRTVVFTRQIRGRTTLSLLDVPTKRVKDVTHNLGSCSQPAWAK